jgi:hypothetical protein
MTIGYSGFIISTNQIDIIPRKISGRELPATNNNSHQIRLQRNQLIGMKIGDRVEY